MKASSDVAFSESVKRIQTERGSRKAYARMETNGGFETEVTDDLVEFLAGIETAFLATASADGQPYIQHRGGPKGFIRALDAHTLAFVDYTGNRQYVSAGNLAENDKVCLFLMDYAHKRRVKIWGTARMHPIANDQRVVEITVSAWDINCPKHIPLLADAPSPGDDSE
jgi:predicted pyridoxine 5'-phosphate oxidase superfamily flavin-nucleotide-binding protein